MFNDDEFRLMLAYNTDSPSGQMMESFRKFTLEVHSKFIDLYKLFDRCPDIKEPERVEMCQEFMEDITKWYRKLNEELEEMKL